MKRGARTALIRFREKRIFPVVEHDGRIEPCSQTFCQDRLPHPRRAFDGDVAKQQAKKYSVPGSRGSRSPVPPLMGYPRSMAWFKKVRKPIEAANKESRVPEGLWVKCPSCGQVIYNKDLAASLSVCTKCSHHFRLTSAERLRSLFDGDWEEHDVGLKSTDPLQFTDTKPYEQRLKASIESTGLSDAVITATGRINGIQTVVAAMEYSFIGGSMGVVVGEKITRAIERALDAGLPVIIVSCSGGARMMEGALSLMQMAKISAALARLDRARLPYISVLTDPTTGGVTASFAMLGDVNIAEPKALIGFAGPRVIEQTIRQQLPEGFQRSEFLLDHGMLDIVVDRRELKDVITRILRFGGQRRRRRGRQRLRRAAARSGELTTDALTYLYSLERLGMKFGLENISTLCAALDHPERAFRSIVIAGTNGKGSVTAMVHQALVAAGHRAARYTSPHLERLEERFVIGDREVDTAELDAAAGDRARRDRAARAHGRARRAADVLRDARPRSRSSCSAGRCRHRGARGRTRRTPGRDERRHAGRGRDHLHRLRSRGAARSHPRVHRLRESRRHQARHPGRLRALCPARPNR